VRLLAIAGATWNPVHDVELLWRYPFMRHAFVAGTAVAVMCGVVGWFVVLRREAYAAHSLAMVAFPGATAAAYLGLAPVLGYFAGGAVGALVVAGLDRGSEGEVRRRHSAVVGSVQAAALGLGLLFASLYRGFLANVTAFLFGSFLGVTAGQAAALVAVATVVVVVVAAVSRPLLFATVDGSVAAAAGLPVGVLGAGFLLLLALAVAGASQFTGVLLVFSLLVAPAASAQAISARPPVSLALAVALAVASTWVGLAAAFFSDRPVGFWITTIGFVVYVLARAGVAVVAARGRRARL
jgi:zinc/manganese transport system permease protein